MSVRVNLFQYFPEYSALWFSLVNLHYLLFQLGNSDMSVPTIPPIGMGFSTSDGTFAQDYPPQLDLAKNPLADTHDFKQACSSCYIKTGKRQSCRKCC